MVESTAAIDERRPAPHALGLTPDRLAWLVRLRWVALLGIVIGAALAALGAYPGVNWRVLFATAAGAAFYNALMWRDLDRGVVTAQHSAMYQALIDFLLLTLVLWASGGLSSPFTGFYVFHVALVGILSGPRATLLAAGAALMCAGLLWVTESVPLLRIGEWQPVGIWAPLASAVAFASTVGAIAYLVLHAAAELRDRERTAAALAERQQVLAERIASLSRVAQGVAHELNTPLATIRTLAADMVAALRSLEATDETTRGQLSSDLAESASLIKEETTRLGRIAQGLLAGGDLVRLRISGSIPLGAVVQRASTLVFAGIRPAPRLDIDRGLDGVLLRCDQDRLLQVLVNLLQNAYDAVRKSGGGRISVSIVGNGNGHGGDAVCLSVEDDGAGIDPRVRERLFEPFATTKPSGEGTGLGLYISYMLVQAMNGTLTLEERPPRGTRALLTLPLDSAGAGDQAPAQRGALG
jgi:signal transduction histidine kinase